MSKQLIERLRSEGDGVMSRREKTMIADRIEELECEIAELVADATRYRFLRKFLSSKDLLILTGRGERDEPDEQYAMDCVVDVAIAKVRKP